MPAKGLQTGRLLKHTPILHLSERWVVFRKPAPIGQRSVPDHSSSSSPSSLTLFWDERYKETLHCEAPGNHSHGQRLDDEEKFSREYRSLRHASRPKLRHETKRCVWEECPPLNGMEIPHLLARWLAIWTQAWKLDEPQLLHSAGSPHRLNILHPLSMDNLVSMSTTCISVQTLFDRLQQGQQRLTTHLIPLRLGVLSVKHESDF